MSKRFAGCENYRNNRQKANKYIYIFYNLLGERNIQCWTERADSAATNVTNVCGEHECECNSSTVRLCLHTVIQHTSEFTQNISQF